MYKLKNAIPNIFTLANLSLGILSLIMSFQGNYNLACYFIILAAIMDRYDGKLARHFNVSSALGKELDSLADLVSFGVSPSVLIFNSNNFQNLGLLGYLLLLIFPMCGAYRLARYNISSFDGAFYGIPITIAGILLSIYTLVTLHSIIHINITILIILILSYLMVSAIRLKKV